MKKFYIFPLILILVITITTIYFALLSFNNTNVLLNWAQLGWPFLSYSYWTEFPVLCMAVVPVKLYNNSDVEKKSILADNKKKIGVYLWVNKENGKTYVGSSINLTSRFYTYFNAKSLNRLSPESLICRALLKYGYSGFELHILEYCDKTNITEREQYYINLLNPEYNILTKADSFSGYKHTEETKKKWSEMRKKENLAPETIEKLRKGSLGRIFNHTEESKAKISAAKLGTKASAETRAKLSVAQSSRIKHPRPGFSIQVTDINTGVTNLYDSIRSAGRTLGVSPVTVKRHIKNQKLYNNQMKITFAVPSS